MPRTVYRVRDHRGGTHTLASAERAERLARAGYVVTAETRSGQ